MTLAIKGHATRGEEVIEILEMLGGENTIKYDGSYTRCYYFLDDTLICSTYGRPHLQCYTLEEFLEKFPYKVGDKVIFTKYGDNDVVTIESMSWTGTTIEYNYNGGVPCLAKDLQQYKEETMEIPEKLKPVIDLTEYTKDEYIVKLGDYEIKEVDGVVKAIRKQSQYPNTYEECCEVLGIKYSSYCVGYREILLSNLQQLLICRNAYWKIAGEQMGLGKPWEPTREKVYVISRNDIVIKGSYYGGKSNILEFPTEEMRDAFYENFKDLIDQCKELL